MKSCGSREPYWSDEEMPTHTGLPITNITMYSTHAETAYEAAHNSSNCRDHPKPLQVIRCTSAKDDFIYKFYSDGGADYHVYCINTFCGMDSEESESNA